MVVINPSPEGPLPTCRMETMFPSVSGFLAEVEARKTRIVADTSSNILRRCLNGSSRCARASGFFSADFMFESFAETA